MSSEYINITISDCNFTGNTAVSYGGALYMNGLCTNIDTSEFYSNSAFQGGALCIKSMNAAVTMSKFGNNNAFQGGVLYASKKCSVLILSLIHI